MSIKRWRRITILADSIVLAALVLVVNLVPGPTIIQHWKIIVPIGVLCAGFLLCLQIKGEDLREQEFLRKDRALALEKR